MDDVPDTFRRFPDRAHRASDVVTQHMTDTARTGEMPWCVGMWVALRLSDGSSDGILYPSKAHAVAHQLHAHQCAYVAIPPTGMTPREADATLRVMEGLYDMGADIADPDQQIHAPTTIEGRRALMRTAARYNR